MFSEILINKQKLLDNIIYIKSCCKGKLCAMVKANAYGHGDEEIVSLLNEYVDCFGVSNEYEALRIKKIAAKQIIVFGLCQDYNRLIENEIGFSIVSLNQVKEIVRSSKSGPKPIFHLCVNTGMNRYGIRSINECKKIISYLQKRGIVLGGIYTHLSSLTTDKEYSAMQLQKFEDYRALVPTEWKTIAHIGGGKSIFENYNVDMNRVGLYLYGYGDKMLSPILSVQSKIVDTVEVKKGEHIGYLCAYTATKNMKVATIPLGYGDGLPRKLSNKLEVKINGHQTKVVGNICMDAFMVDVTNVDCSIGDNVVVFDNASQIASILDTTEYEVLTNLRKFRGEVKIID